MEASRAFRSIAFALGTLAAASAFAATPALVVDVASGKVLYAERATDPWFPASVTKLMTTYVALKAVRDGKVSLDTLLKVSENAVSMPPSKMGFRPGTEVTLDNALKIIMVKSANDVATVIAEGIGGSVENFAGMMNEAARSLGMRESHWVNPHGLPDPAQHTSARDMAILGRALLRDFPEYRGYFQLSAIKLGRRVMANHNGLIGRYPGVDGMKTGFICSSGFNVVASATREGRQLITVVMGSRSATERTLQAADLFDRGFATSAFLTFGGRTLEELPASTVTEPPDLRPYICGRRGKMPSEDDQEVASGDRGPFAAHGFSLVSTAAAAPRTLPPRAPLQPVLVWTGATPTSNVAEDNAEEPRARGKGRKGKMIAGKPAVKSLARAGKTDQASPAAQAFVANKPAAIMDNGSGVKAKTAVINPAAALAKAVAKPKADARPKLAAAPAKPKLKADKKPAQATDAKKTAEAKPKTKPKSKAAE